MFIQELNERRLIQIKSLYLILLHPAGLFFTLISLFVPLEKNTSIIQLLYQAAGITSVHYTVNYLTMYRNFTVKF